MPTNVSVHYQKAEAEYLQSETKEQKIKALKKMISLAPSHKGAESLRAQLKKRLAKLKYSHEKELKKRKSGKKGIKKADLQAVLIGLTNSGKSSLLKNITNAKPKISDIEFTTLSPIIGTLDWKGIQSQIIDMPSINHENFEQSIADTTDLLIIIITNIKDLNEIEPFLANSKSKKLIVFNKIDLLNEQEKRKISETLKSKKYNFVLYSALKKTNEEHLKDKIIENFNIIRIYTKKPEEKQTDKRPVLLKPNSTIKELAEKIRIPLDNIKKVKITGPSSKFPNQEVGLSHILKDKDLVELYTK